MKKMINSRFLWITCVAIVTTVVFSAFIYYESFQKEVRSDLDSYAAIMEDADAYGVVSAPYEVTDEMLEGAFPKVRITLIDPEGKVLVDTGADTTQMPNHSNRPEILEAFRNGSGFAVRTSETVSRSSFYYAELLDNGCVLRVAKTTGNIFSIFADAFPVIGVLSILLVAICIVLSNYLTKDIIKPIDEMAKHISDVGYTAPYEELIPFTNAIQEQHEEILNNANLRQEFTANVSHELKTPLTSISGYSELIQSGIATGEDVQRFAGEIHRSADRLLTLINDILQLSELDHMTEAEKEAVDLYQIAMQTKDLLTLVASKQNVRVEVQGTTATIMANRKYMEELIYNLVDNAIRYNNPGGQVDVKVCHDRENKVLLEVKDTGIGIPKEHQERIFERFYRVDKSRSKSTGGTGLGLAIVKHIVANQRNAGLKLESEEGKGTCIQVVFQ